MATSETPRVVVSSETPQKRLSPAEWKVFRACQRCGAEASTADILRELKSKNDVYDYRTVQILLKRMEAKGYLRVEKPDSRSNVYTSIVPLKDVLAREVRFFLDQVIGLEPDNIQLVRDALDDLERYGPFVAFDESSLPSGLRPRLVAFVEDFIHLRRDRWALAAALRLEPAALDRHSSFAGALSLLVNAGGDTISAVIKLLDAIDQLLEPDDVAKARELSALKRELQSLSVP